MVTRRKKVTEGDGEDYIHQMLCYSFHILSYLNPGEGHGVSDKIAFMTLINVAMAIAGNNRIPMSQLREEYLKCVNHNSWKKSDGKTEEA